VPYSDPAARRRVQRESQRRRRARQRGAAAVNPSTRPSARRSGAAPLSPADLGALVADELRAVRNASAPGDHERARVIVALVGAALRCFEMSDVAARLEALEDALGVRAEKGRHDAPTN